MTATATATATASPAVTASPSPTPSATPTVTPTPLLPRDVAASWLTRKGKTSVRKLEFSGRAGSTVRVTCKGPGRSCAFKSKRVSVPTDRKVRLVSLFARRQLAAGTVIVVTVTKPGAVGWRATFTTQKRGKPRRRMQTL